MRHNKILSLTVALHLSQFSSDLYAFINGVSAFLRLSLNKLSYYIMVREPHILLVLLLFPVNLVSFNAHNQLIPKHLTLSSTWDSSTNFFSSVWGYLRSCVTPWKNFFSWKFETFATKEISKLLNSELQLYQRTLPTWINLIFRSITAHVWSRFGLKCWLPNKLNAHIIVFHNWHIKSEVEWKMLVVLTT